eukprot:TRINITY_DN83836_c0_g1_i1.p1 TRINITY_DN83836_c0_g1~~TRINITY_DN83836_c0_g1_i1.p1  ORF type:complete len:507 (-),score=94.99 TRINITY_DN83836_c0_g1_i1:26-1546(-)
MAQEDEVAYLRRMDVANVLEDLVSQLLRDRPEDVTGFLVKLLKIRRREELVSTKLRGAGLSPAFIRAFLNSYRDLVDGNTGSMPESTIEPVASLPALHSLPSGDTGLISNLLSRTVVLKLNGGLGTSMGLEKAKSLLRVKGDKTFLDFIAQQIVHLRQTGAPGVRFMFMDSFSTSADTQQFLRQHYPDLAREDWELLQHKAPKIDAQTLEPASWSANSELEWCPPGHGDLYAALLGSGALERLLKEGKEFMFISNSDNLGATLDPRLLSAFSSSGAPMMMEVCERTEMDKKGGHLCRTKAGQLVLRESAQCPKEDEPQFQDIHKHKFFNTNNLWLHLPQLRKAMDQNGGYLPLPLIRNAKTVDPRDANSTKVYQIETAMGAAIGLLQGSQAVVVPRERFAPVKTCADLLVLRSDAYCVTPAFTLQLASGLLQAPVVELDSNYKLVDQLDAAIPEGAPSLLRCTRLKVSGLVTFAKDCVLSGNVEIQNSSASTKRVEGSISDKKLTV